MVTHVSILVVTLASATARAATLVDNQVASATDATVVLVREDDFLRGISDFGLVHALDDLERTDPAQSASDAATPHLRVLAKWRMILRLPTTAFAARRDAFDQLRRAREALIAAHPHDARVALWLVDGAEDEFVLGFLGLDGGTEAIAGSPMAEVLPRAQRSLARVRTLLDRASEAARFDSVTTLAQQSALAQRLSDDAQGRRPFLTAAIEAFSIAIDRTNRDPVVARARPALAAPLHTAIVEARPRIPARLRPEADLAEVAAAATAVRIDDARFGAARILLNNDPILATLSRILVADGLVNGRLGTEALQQLIALNMSANMPTGLRLLAADAFVRTRVVMGKSPSDATTLEAWIVTLRSAPPLERAAVRRAVLDRIANALRGTTVVGTLPALAMVARAGDSLLTDATDTAAETALRSFADQSADPETQVAALVVLADVYSAHGEWGRAADCYRLFAQCAAKEPTAATAIATALDIELALDRARPDARASALEATLEVAVTRFTELPSRSRSAAQLLALQIIRRSDQLAATPVPPSSDAAESLWSSAVQLNDLAASAQRAGFDPGPRVAAALTLASIAHDLLAPSDAPRGATVPTMAQWEALTTTDAQRVLRLRLDRAAEQPNTVAAFQGELEAIPPSLFASESQHACPALLQFMQLSVARAQSLDRGADSAGQSTALRALEAATVWETLHPDAAVPTTDSYANAFCATAADAALIAQAWDGATARARALASQPAAQPSDFLRAALALAQAARAADAAGETSRRDALRTESMDAARRLATKVARGSPQWWAAQVIQLEVAELSGRGGEPLQARLARLRAFDANLGGEPYKSALEKFAPL